MSPSASARVRRTGSRWSALALAVAAVPLGVGLGATTAAYAAPAARPYDFDGRGYPDLVVGAPRLRVGQVFEAGGVVVLPATSAGLSLTEQVVTQSSPGVPGGSENGDDFGRAVASADFDRDGYADLAVGQPRESAGDGFDTTGGVTVVYGSSRGLDTRRSARLPGAEPGSTFGAALVAADLTGDGYPDLAVGAPEDLTDGGLGSVRVLPGSSGGLTAAGSTVLRGPAGPDDVRFGTRLAVGDLDGDAAADLVVGAEGGSVTVCPGALSGPGGCQQVARGFDALGALAVGDVLGGTGAQVLVGRTGVGQGDPGDVTVLELDPDDGTVTRRVTVDQDSPGVPGSGESGDEFGASLAVGDLDRDGYADLVVGAPGETRNEGNLRGVGRVTVIRGGPDGYQTTGNVAYDQDSAGIPGAAEQEDLFGSAVTLLDHDGDGNLDLTVGAQWENGGQGAVTTLRGTRSGFTTAGARTFGLATLGYANPGEAEFGSVLGR